MSIGKKLRFEVFKRDKFTCQYCGKTAPDVILHVDHIQPQSKGGTDDMVNLITSCQDCNLGKGARELSDDTAVVKQRNQLELLQERREQIEMIMEWQRGLMDMEQYAVEELVSMWNDLMATRHLNQAGILTVSQLTKKYSIPEIAEAMRIAATQYFEYDRDGDVLAASCSKALNKLSGICYVRSVEEERPYIHDLFYIRGILRNTTRDRYLTGCLDAMMSAIDRGVSVEQLRTLAKRADYYENWLRDVETLAESSGRATE